MIHRTLVSLSCFLLSWNWFLGEDTTDIYICYGDMTEVIMYHSVHWVISFRTECCKVFGWPEKLISFLFLGNKFYATDFSHRLCSLRSSKPNLCPTCRQLCRGCGNSWVCTLLAFHLVLVLKLFLTIIFCVLPKSTFKFFIVSKHENTHTHKQLHYKC